MAKRKTRNALQQVVVVSRQEGTSQTRDCGRDIKKGRGPQRYSACSVSPDRFNRSSKSQTAPRGRAVGLALASAILAGKQVSVPSGKTTSKASRHRSPSLEDCKASARKTSQTRLLHMASPQVKQRILRRASSDADEDWSRELRAWSPERRSEQNRRRAEAEEVIKAKEEAAEENTAATEFQKSCPVTKPARQLEKLLTDVARSRPVETVEPVSSDSTSAGTSCPISQTLFNDSLLVDHLTEEERASWKKTTCSMEEAISGNSAREAALPELCSAEEALPVSAVVQDHVIGECSIEEALPVSCTIECEQALPESPEPDDDLSEQCFEEDSEAFLRSLATQDFASPAWVQFVDPQTQLPYFYNVQTHERSEVDPDQKTGPCSVEDALPVSLAADTERSQQCFLEISFPAGVTSEYLQSKEMEESVGAPDDCLDEERCADDTMLTRTCNENSETDAVSVWMRNAVQYYHGREVEENSEADALSASFPKEDHLQLESCVGPTFSTAPEDCLDEEHHAEETSLTSLTTEANHLGQHCSAEEALLVSLSLEDDLGKQHVVAETLPWRLQIEKSLSEQTFVEEAVPVSSAIEELQGSDADDMCLSDMEELLESPAPLSLALEEVQDGDAEDMCLSDVEELLEQRDTAPDAEGEVHTLLKELAAQAKCFDAADYWINGAWDLAGLREDAERQNQERWAHEETLWRSVQATPEKAHAVEAPSPPVRSPSPEYPLIARLQPRRLPFSLDQSSTASQDIGTFAKRSLRPDSDVTLGRKLRRMLTTSPTRTF